MSDSRRHLSPRHAAAAAAVRFAFACAAPARSWPVVVGIALFIAAASRPSAARAQCCQPEPLGNICIPGNSNKVACQLEWALMPVPLLNAGVPMSTLKRNGLPTDKFVCYEGDPRCDVDPDLTNGSCTFQAQMCINNSDSRKSCSGHTGVVTFEVLRPNPLRLDSADTANLATLEGIAGAAPPNGFGVTVLRGSEVVSAGSPNYTHDLCSNPLDLVVPLVRGTGGHLHAGRKTIRVSTASRAFWNPVPPPTPTASSATPPPTPTSTPTPVLNYHDRSQVRLFCRPSTCGDGVIQADHETCDDGNRTNGDGCDQACQVEGGYTCSGEPSVCQPQPAPASGACGNGIVDMGETCDDGGTCIGGSNAGTHCTADSQCNGNGVCDVGTHYGQSCASDTDCGGARCLHCKTFGGDGCAADCTTETTISASLQPGEIQANAAACPTGSGCASGTSCLSLHGGLSARLPLPGGSGSFVVGKPDSNGNVPFVIPAASMSMPAVPVSTVACACLRAIAQETCGGVLLESDGTPATDCTLQDNCASLGLPPCTYVNGPGNAAAGVIGCGNVFTPVDLSVSQDGGGVLLPPPPTPTPGVAPPMLTFSGWSTTNTTGSAVAISAFRLGQTQGFCTVPPGSMQSIYGADGVFCTDDDPEDVRGLVQAVPLVTGSASGVVTNSNSPGVTLGPFSAAGGQFDCASLVAGTSVSRSSLAGTFTFLSGSVPGNSVYTLVLGNQ